MSDFLRTHVDRNKLKTQNTDFCVHVGEIEVAKDIISNDDVIWFVISLHQWQFKEWFPALCINIVIGILKKLTFAISDRKSRKYEYP